MTKLLGPDMGRPRKNPIPDAPVEAEAPEKSVRSRDEMEAERHAEEFLKRNRPNLTGFEQKLAYYGERKGWVRRWVVDHANRIQSLLENGWRFVQHAEVQMSDSIGHGNTDLGDKVSISTTMGEGPVRQILMEVPQKLYDMQVEASMDPVRRSEEALKSGGLGLNNTENTYFPEWAKNRIVSKLQ